MEITLEKIDLVRDRTGVSYKEAKQALENTNGDIIEAIIYIEEKKNSTWSSSVSEAGNEVLEKIKDVIKKGNVTKIILKKDEDIIMNIPVTAGAVGALISPPIAMLGFATALLSKCKIEIIKTDGKVIDIQEMAEDTLDNAKSKMNEYKEKITLKKDENNKDDNDDDLEQ
ncbi:DUF4342 domain-containing protein [Lutibacter sp. B2]|nr:DUF4342 domain-containing protein [Lutibacter sp. B2]